LEEYQVHKGEEVMPRRTKYKKFKKETRWYDGTFFGITAFGPVGSRKKPMLLRIFVEGFRRSK
tara:strand:+ start:10880 stop:11068 length:189 start_codon:yes stop_codon:yes gene_type:complete